MNLRQSRTSQHDLIAAYGLPAAQVATTTCMHACITVGAEHSLLEVEQRTMQIVTLVAKRQVELRGKPRRGAHSRPSVRVTPEKQRPQCVSECWRRGIRRVCRITDNDLSAEMVIHRRVQHVQMSHEPRCGVERHGAWQPSEVPCGCEPVWPLWTSIGSTDIVTTASFQSIDHVVVGHSESGVK